jgi:hypothetical protein
VELRDFRLLPGLFLQYLSKRYITTFTLKVQHGTGKAAVLILATEVTEGTEIKRFYSVFNSSVKSIGQLHQLYEVKKSKK